VVCAKLACYANGGAVGFVRSRRARALSAREENLKKSKTSRRSKSRAKNSLAPRSHYDWNVTEAQLTTGLDDDLRDAWHKLRAFAAGLGTQRIYASALSIMFSKKVCYFFVRPRKTFLEVWIFLPRKIEGLRSMHGPTKKVKYCNLFKVVHADQIEAPLTNWIREAFDFAPAPAVTAR
jgi:hypothetical protein